MSEGSKSLAYLGQAVHVLPVLQAEADDGRVEKGREQRAGPVACHDAREVPQLDVDDGVIFGADRDGLEVRSEGGRRLWVSAGLQPSRARVEAYRNKQAAGETVEEGRLAGVHIADEADLDGARGDQSRGRTRRRSRVGADAREKVEGREGPGDGRGDGSVEGCVGGHGVGCRIGRIGREGRGEGQRRAGLRAGAVGPAAAGPGKGALEGSTHAAPLGRVLVSIRNLVIVGRLGRESAADLECEEAHCPDKQYQQPHSRVQTIPSRHINDPPAFRRAVPEAKPPPKGRAEKDTVRGRNLKLTALRLSPTRAPFSLSKAVLPSISPPFFAVKSTSSSSRSSDSFWSLSSLPTVSVACLFLFAIWRDCF